MGLLENRDPCRSHSSSEGEIEIPSENSIFLPTPTDSDQDDSDCHLNYEDMENSEEVRRCSRNLGMLVISEGIPLDPEKVAVAIDIVDIVPRDKTVNVSRRGSKVGSVNGTVDFEKGEKVNSPLEKKSRCGNYTGILLTLASGLVFTIGGMIVKYMKGYHPFTLAIFRFQGILLPSMIWVLYSYYVQKLPIFEPIWPPTQRDKAMKIFGMLVRCVFGSTALFLHFYALQRLDVADALVIGACQPVFVTLAAYVFLGEACGIFPVFTAFFTIFGVGIISRPPILTGEEEFDDNALIGAGFSVASMLTATMVFVVIRYLKDVHVSLLTLVLGCWGTLQSIVCSIIVGEFRMPDNVEHWVLAVALAVITLLGQVGLTLALQCEQAGPVALIRTCDCLFGFILQFIFMSVVPDIFSLTGASIIIFCVALTAFRKWVSTLPANNPTKKKFAFVMK